MKDGREKNYCCIILVNVVLIALMFVAYGEYAHMYFTKEYHDYLQKMGYPVQLTIATLAKYRLYRTHREYHSDHYNTDENGFRSSAGIKNIFKDFNPDDYNIFVFGGSETFGYLIKDNETFSYSLNELIKQKGYKNVKVYNLAQDGFSIQDEIYLLLDQLRQGRTPQMAIFFEGLNLPCPTTVDKGAIYRDELFPESKIKAFFTTRYGRMLYAKLYNETLTFIKYNVFFMQRTYEPSRYIPYLCGRQECTKEFMVDVGLIDGLLSKYNSKAYYFLQPAGFFLPNRVGYWFGSFFYKEKTKQVDNEERAYAMAAYFYAIMRHKGNANIFDIHNSLNELAKTHKDLFADLTHPSGAGNRAKADIVFNIIADDIYSPVSLDKITLR